MTTDTADTADIIDSGSTADTAETADLQRITMEERYRTRDKLPVRVLCVDYLGREGELQVVYLVNRGKHEEIHIADEFGRYSNLPDHPMDIVPVPEPVDADTLMPGQTGVVVDQYVYKELDGKRVLRIKDGFVLMADDYRQLYGQVRKVLIDE